MRVGGGGGWAARRLAFVALLLSAPALHAQEACARVEVADSLYFAGDPDAAWALLDAHPDCTGSRSAWRWRAVRAAIAVGRGKESVDDRWTWFERAVVLARRAREPGPPTPDDVYWSGVARMHRASVAAPSLGSELAREAQREFRLLLRVDSLHGGAHHGLGVIALEALTLSTTERLFGRIVLGLSLPDDIDWDSAESHLRRAAELWPHEPEFHFDLARLLVERGRVEEGVLELRAALATPDLHPFDPEVKRGARDLLASLDPEGRFPPG